MWSFPIPDECVLFVTLGGAHQRVGIINFTPGTGPRSDIDIEAAFALGQLVRIKPELAQPSRGWQGTAVNHNAIGFIAGFETLARTPFLIIHFPGHDGFIASASDVDLFHEVAAGGEDATKLLAPEDSWRLRTSGALTVRNKVRKSETDGAAAACEPQRPYGQTWWRYRCVHMPVGRSVALLAPGPRVLANYWTWATAQKGKNIDFLDSSSGGVGAVMHVNSANRSGSTTEGARGDKGWTSGMHTWTMRFKSGTGTCSEARPLSLAFAVVFLLHSPPAPYLSLLSSCLRTYQLTRPRRSLLATHHPPTANALAREQARTELLDSAQAAPDSSRTLTRTFLGPMARAGGGTRLARHTTRELRFTLLLLCVSARTMTSRCASTSAVRRGRLRCRKCRKGGLHRIYSPVSRKLHPSSRAPRRRCRAAKWS